MSQHIITWAIAAVATGGVIARPFGSPEAIWAVCGAVLLVVLGLLPWRAALGAVGTGLDVYLFLAGMMLLSETARREGLFDWLAALATRAARGSTRRLFLLIYLVGIVVTAFLSNDACAVVLTPAVYAVTRAARTEPLPYLFICAFVANAASFALPISNPANLVLYASHLPPLPQWIDRFAIPSILAIAATYAALRFAERRSLCTAVTSDVELPRLSSSGRVGACGIAATAVILLAASSANLRLGLPTCIAGAATAAIVLLCKREAPWAVLRGVSWSVLPLVAGLFVLVAGLAQTGLIEQIGAVLGRAAADSATGTALAAGAILAFGSNLTNNLPAGLIAASAIGAAHPPRLVTDALLIGVDLGPNLSVTGSLATILWLVALRREGLQVGFLRFLRVGVIVMPPALLLAFAALVLTH
ncbi:MAG: arsenic transporter [Acetobacteraceae bacterium]